MVAATAAVLLLLVASERQAGVHNASTWRAHLARLAVIAHRVCALERGAPLLVARNEALLRILDPVHVVLNLGRVDHRGNAHGLGLRQLCPVELVRLLQHLADFGERRTQHGAVGRVGEQLVGKRVARVACFCEHGGSQCRSHSRGEGCSALWPFSQYLTAALQLRSEKPRSPLMLCTRAAERL